jgi:hypothetical protein
MMIDTLWNLLFRCAHRHLTRPFTPRAKEGAPRDETYVVCLDCTKQFAYDWNLMRIGKAIPYSHHACIIPPVIPKPRKTKLVYALGMAIPVAVALGTALAAPKKPEGKKRGRRGLA